MIFDITKSTKLDNTDVKGMIILGKYTFVYIVLPPIMLWVDFTTVLEK